MKKMKAASLLVASMMIFSVFFGCNKEPDATSSVGSTPSVSAPESQVSSSEVPPASSGASSTDATPSEGATTLENIVTSNKEFNKLFAKNPIDKAYLTEMEKAASSTDMIAVNEKYTDIWKTEIDEGYKKLLAKAPADKKSSYQKTQEKWVKETPAELEKISTAAQNAGSMAQLEVSGETMEYYRNRAARIYKNLYTHDAKFTYSYK